MDKENAKLPDDKLEEVNGGARTHGLERTIQYFCSTCEYVFEEKKIAGGTDVCPSEQFCPNCKKYVYPSHKTI